MATLRCKDAFATKVAGAPRVIAAGELVDADDPVVKGRESFFEPLESFMATRRTTEQATAAPGEARTVSTTKRGTRKAAGSGD